MRFVKAEATEPALVTEALERPGAPYRAEVEIRQKSLIHPKAGKFSPPDRLGAGAATLRLSRAIERVWESECINGSLRRTSNPPLTHSFSRPATHVTHANFKRDQKIPRATACE